LLEVKQKGRERFCEARLEKLGEVHDWVEQYRQMWEMRLNSLDNYLKELQAKSISQPKTKENAKRKRSK
jgi:hypothetical protein